MSEGRKTRRFKETNDKAELDRQWKKISAVSVQCWGVVCLGHQLPAEPRRAPTSFCPGPAHVLAAMQSQCVCAAGLALSRSWICSL